jgi:hypothetical protein
MHTNFCLENLRRRDHLEELGANGMILKCIIKQQGRTAWNGFIWLKTAECV